MIRLSIQKSPKKQKIIRTKNLVRLLDIRSIHKKINYVPICQQQ